MLWEEHYLPPSTYMSLQILRLARATVIDSRDRVCYPSQPEFCSGSQMDVTLSGFKLPNNQMNAFRLNNSGAQ